MQRLQQVGSTGYLFITPSLAFVFDDSIEGVAMFGGFSLARDKTISDFSPIGAN
jgi:hypothetical protein